MSPSGSTAPESNPAMQRMLVESRARLRRAVADRERTVELAAAALFLIAASLIAILAEPTQDLDWFAAAILVALYAVATKVEFRMGHGWTDPSQLVFVPMLFVLPTQLVPLFVAAAMLVSRLPEYARGTVHVQRAALRIADASYSLWPAAVLLAFGVTQPEWSEWPIYLLALAAQFTCDAVTSTARVTLALGVDPKPLLRELRDIYAVDALLSPIGLLAAMAAWDQHFAVLALLPLLGLLVVFAREREARIESALTLTAAYRGTAHLLGELLSTSDEYTGDHSRSVVMLAHRVGEELRLDEMTMREVEFGALLHDVGKLAVPLELLQKPGALTPEEMEEMKRHTAAGERMLERIGGVLGEVGTVVRSHHERWDGAGYPDGLRRGEIPIAARVIAACDAFNAMTTDRPYRAAMAQEEAIEELRREAGRQFDPAVVEALIAVLAGFDESAVTTGIDELVAGFALEARD